MGGAAIAAVMGESEEDEEIPIAAAVGEAAWVRKLQDDTISRIKKEVTDPLTAKVTEHGSTLTALIEQMASLSSCVKESSASSEKGFARLEGLIAGSARPHGPPRGGGGKPGFSDRAGCLALCCW